MNEQFDEIDKKALSTTQLYLSSEALCEEVKETSAPSLWLKLESLYMMKPVTNRLSLKSQLHDVKLAEGKLVNPHLE